jgi:tetratricopeptide (TPR) repeat protein
MAELIPVSGNDSLQRCGDVVFVHGLNGNPGDYWGASDSYWPKWLGDALPDVGVWSLGYENAAFRRRRFSPISFFLGLFAGRGFAMPLVHRAWNVLLRLETYEVGQRPLVFITHSMGGLLVKQILRTARDCPADSFEGTLLQNTKGVCFIATPHIGADLANLISKMKILFKNNISVDELKAHASQLLELHRWYLNYVTTDGVETQTISFFETRPTPVVGLVVEAGDANPGIPRAGCYPLDDDHSSICKPKSQTAELHLKTVKFVARCLRSEGDSGWSGQPGPPPRPRCLPMGPNGIISGQGSIVSEIGGRVDTQIEYTKSASEDFRFDLEIDEAELCVKNKDADRAKALLERVMRQHWDELSQQQKYRVKAGLANVAHSQGRDFEAGKFLLEAKDYFPESERAQINEALAFEFMRDECQAHSLATELLKTYPSSSKLVGIYIRTAPPEASLEELAANASRVHTKDAEVCTALALRAMRLHRFDRAEEYARAAIEANPDWFGPRFILGQSLLHSQLARTARLQWQGQSSLDVGRLREAVTVIDDAIGTLAEGSFLLTDALVIRGWAKHLMGDVVGAEKDFGEATERSPSNPEALHRYAAFLAEVGRNGESIAQLRRSLTIRKQADVELFLANMLSLSGEEVDRRDASMLFVKLATSNDDYLKSGVFDVNPERVQFQRMAAFYSAVEMLVSMGRYDEAEDFLGRVPSDKIGLSGLCSARSKIHLARGDAQEASRLADEALRNIAEASSDLDVRSLALQLSALGRYKEALTLWLRINEAAVSVSDVRPLVRCAEEVGRFDVILKVAKAARDAGIGDTWLFDKEVGILEQFDVKSAIDLLQERLERQPSDTHARMVLSYLGLRWKKPELIDARSESLPSVEEVAPSGGAIAVEILRRHGDLKDALRYAYELVRRYPDVSEPNEAYIRLFLDPSSKPLPRLEVSRVDVGIAVRYVEADGREDWIIIEDSPNPRHGFKEFPPSHPLAKALSGSHVGDTVTLAKTGGRDRTALIKEVLSKYVFRFHEIVRNWQLNFQDRPFVQMFHVVGKDPETGEEKPDFTDLKLIADRQFQETNEALEHYRTRLMPLHVLAHRVGCEPFLGAFVVASHPDFEIRSNRAGDAEQMAAMDLLGSNPTLVLDLTALAMAWMLDLGGLLKKWRGKLVISQSTEMELRSAKEKFATRAVSVGHYGKTEKGYFLETESPETRRAELDAFTAFMDTVLEVCEVRGCPALAEFDPEKRDAYIGVFGQHGIESILLAQTPNHALWTDDITVGDIATAEFGVRRIWVQPFMAHSVNIKMFTFEEYIIDVAKLVGYDYHATSFNLFVAVKAGSMAFWDAEKWPFNKMLNQFTNPSIPAEQVVLFASSILSDMYKDTVLAGTRQATLIRILEQIASRKNGIELVHVFLKLVPKVFGVNVLAADEVREVSLAWLAQAERRLIIPPGDTPA